jgi:hypothetical protein
VAVETSHAKDVARGDGGRLRALQEELSMPGDLSFPGIEIKIETPEVSPASKTPAAWSPAPSKSSKKPTLSLAPSSQCPGVIKSSKSGKGEKGDTYCPGEACGRCVALFTLFEEQGCWDLIAGAFLKQCLALPAIEELLFDQIPKCLILFAAGYVGDCVNDDLSNEQQCADDCYPDSAFPQVAVAGSGSGSGTLFGLTMNDLNDYARANLPKNIAF